MLVHDPGTWPQRLVVDRSAERIEVGHGLSEPEREWLAEVLHAWLGK